MDILHLVDRLEELLTRAEPFHSLIMSLSTKIAFWI